jgi:hypothetical protein
MGRANGATRRPSKLQRRRAAQQLEARKKAKGVGSRPTS